jgi:hypothetical protein
VLNNNNNLNRNNRNNNNRNRNNNNENMENANVEFANEDNDAVEAVRNQMEQDNNPENC